LRTIIKKCKVFTHHMDIIDTDVTHFNDIVQVEIHENIDIRFILITDLFSDFTFGIITTDTESHDLQDERNNAIYESPVYGCKAMIMEPQIRIGINDNPPNRVTHGPRGYDYKLMMIDLQASIAVDNKNTPPPDFIIQ